MYDEERWRVYFARSSFIYNVLDIFISISQKRQKCEVDDGLDLVNWIIVFFFIRSDFFNRLRDSFLTSMYKCCLMSDINHSRVRPSICCSARNKIWPSLLGLSYKHADSLYLGFFLCVLCCRNIFMINGIMPNGNALFMNWPSSKSKQNTLGR